MEPSDALQSTVISSKAQPQAAESKEAPKALLSVFNFADYRQYLQEYYEYRKAKGSYSFAMFSKRAGLASPNYLKLVMDGERNLTDRNIRLFTKALGLNSVEARYFENLVRYCQAESPVIRAHYFETLSEFSNRKNVNVFELQREHYEILRKWHYLPLVELVRCHDFVEDAQWISQKLGKSLTKDLSGGGVRFLAEHPLEPPGTQLEIILRLPECHEPIRFVGRVIWIAPSRSNDAALSGRVSEVGVQFVTIDPKDRALLLQYAALYPPASGS